MVLGLAILILVTFIFLVYLMIYYGRQAIFGDAMRYYKTGETEKAIKSLKSYKSARPSDIKAKLVLGKIYYDQKNFVDSLKEFISVTLNRKSDVEEKSEAYSMIAKIYMEQKEFPKATEAVISGLKTNPKSPALYCYLGQLYAIMGKEKKSIRVFNEALKIDRTHIQTRIELAKLHMAMKNRFKARFQYRKILEINPNNDEARFELARLLHDEGEVDDAAEIMEQLRDISGRERDYYITLYEYHKSQGNVERVEFLIDKMLELGEIFPDLMVALKFDKGSILEDAEKLEEAYSVYKEVKDLNPRYRDIENRLQNLTKMLYPDEYKKMIEGIDYNQLNPYQLTQVFETIIARLGLKLAYEVESRPEKLSAIATDEMNPKDKFLVQLIVMERATNVRDLQIFMGQFEDLQATNGIYITTHSYNDQAVTYSESVHNLEILDKVHMYDLVGEVAY